MKMFLKNKAFCVSKDTIMKVKTPTEWEKIFESHISDQNIYLDHARNFYSLIKRQPN